MREQSLYRVTFMRGPIEVVRVLDAFDANDAQERVLLDELDDVDIREVTPIDDD